MRYRLRTLLIVLALGPPALAGAWFLTGAWEFWFACRIAGIVILAFAFVAALIWIACIALEFLVRLLNW